ncbi:hypothetical protein DVH05_005177 [Phytophthora capsici]|nr:hypothetical protein DVH05_021010 [Phytophthora capsici]KAG1682896.1 hypothetical protein DVH05_018860 [Phytophthora capsici]KAG1683226.1 hypothetical protein DVH05_016467 [Phytophthora capsici]KAG1687486.1 hypothetical protein DVH05_005177 [Phytophthora capsici]
MNIDWCFLHKISPHPYVPFEILGGKIDLRPRSAQKRRQHAAASDESDDGSEDDWTAPSGLWNLQPGGHNSDNSNHANLLSGLSEEVLPPPLERTQFNSWESFHAHLNEYSAQTHQFSRVDEQQGRGAQQEDKERELTSASDPARVDMYNKTLVCTDAGTLKSRGKGKRARQESRATKRRSTHASV